MLNGQLSSLQSAALLGLLVAVGFLFFVIASVVTRSARRRSSLQPSRSEAVDPENLKQDLGSSTQETEASPGDPSSMRKALAKTEDQIFGRIRRLFQTSPEEQELWEKIEEILYTSDIGPQTVDTLVTEVKSELSSKERRSYSLVEPALRKKISSFFEKDRVRFIPIAEKISSQGKPFVLLIVGVNGAGKTTSIGKLAAHFAQSGLKVLVAAGDTFRAAASEQLRAWSDRAQVDIFSPENVSDPSAVAFDAVQKGKSQGFDLIIIDTAGRLHTQTNLMEELKKVKRVVQKLIPEAPHETLIVLDANSGQNALIQAKQFHQALHLTGAILTKMDGTAKGGVAIGLVSEVEIPIHFMGIGEKVADLRPFVVEEFIDSLIPPL
jgi:fused signal recognition particle receptor